MKNFLLFFLLIFISCSKDYLFLRDNHIINNELKKITTTDQYVRHYSMAIDMRYGIRTADTVWDSLLVKGHEDLSIINVAELPWKSKQINKLTPKIKTYYLNEVKDSKFVGKYIDSYNMKKSYHIIKKYGYPSYNLRKWKNDTLRIGIASCLTHYNYDTKFGIKFFDLLVNEYLKKRIDKDELSYLIWNYEGRADDSMGGNINVDAWVEKYLKTKK